MKVILAVMCTTKVVVKIRPEKNSGLYGIGIALSAVQIYDFHIFLTV